MTRRPLRYLALTLFAASAAAQAPTQPAASSEDEAYCNYQVEQAKATGDLLRTPTGLAGFTQPNTGQPTQLVAGGTLSISAVKRAGITVDAARKNCVVYANTTHIQQALQYAVPSIERQALAHRITLIDAASKSLENLIAQTTKMVEAQNMTRPMLLGLQTTRIKLQADRAQTQATLAAIYAPALSAEPLKQQVAAKQSADIAEQQALDHLARQNNWDVALTVGAHQQINPFTNGVQPYGEVTATYNFASRAIDRHLDKSVDAFAQWKKVQEGDAVRGLEVLRQQINDTIAAQQARLDALQQQADEMDKSLALVQSPDTAAAYDFRNQLATTRLLLDVEAGDAAFRLQTLRDFLAKNY
jgi:hypothetical protein